MYFTRSADHVWDRVTRNNMLGEIHTGHSAAPAHTLLTASSRNRVTGESAVRETLQRSPRRLYMPFSVV